MNKIIQEQYEFPFVKEIDEQKKNKLDDSLVQFCLDYAFNYKYKKEDESNFLDGFPMVV